MRSGDAAIRTIFARSHAAQVGIRRGMKILSRRQILDVIVLLIRAADQVDAAFERLVDEQDRLASASFFIPFAQSIPSGPRYPAGESNSA